MKKLLSVISLCVLGLAATGCGGGEYKVALVTDKGTINDGSFNEGSWNGIVKYCTDNDVSYKYYQPVQATDTDRWNSVNLAVKGGAEIVVLPGFLFNSIIADASQTFPDVKFLILDGSYKEDEDFGMTYDPNKDYSNVYSVNYQEEQVGFLAGYGAVMDGHRNLGFMGGIEMPAVKRFGYGYVQGAEQAARDLGLENDAIHMRFTYAGDFQATDKSNALMDTWYGTNSNPVDVVFACGGSIYTSVSDAIKKYNRGKMIGVDVDQAHVGEYVITSATKGLANSVITVLGEYFDGNWADLGGEIDTLGLGKTEGSIEYVGLPTNAESWQFETWTVDQYNALVRKMQTAYTAGSGNSAYQVNNSIANYTSNSQIEQLFGLTKVDFNWSE